MTKHRGKHSNDDKCFSQKWLAILSEAMHDLSFLLGRGYGLKSAVALVGNRYKLNARQQRALSLITCPSDKITSRKHKALSAEQLIAKNIVIDGFNLLINIEALLSNGYLFVCQDSCYRDIASIHGSYKKVEETLPALDLIKQTLNELHINHSQWYFDRPVSNAGMLKTLLYQFATEHQLNWDIELVDNPDKVLSQSTDIIISSDSVIIDNCHCYFNLVEYIVQNLLTEQELNIVDINLDMKQPQR